MLNLIGKALLATGSSDRALDHHRLALTLATTSDAAHDVARAHDGIGHASRALGDRPGARTYWQRAVRLYTEIGVDADTAQAGLDELATSSAS